MNIFKNIFKYILIIFAFLFILWIIFLGMLQTKTGQNWVLKQGTALLERQTGLSVEYSQLEFIFPLSLRVRDLSIANRTEKLADIEQIDLFCIYPHLLQGRLVCSDLSIKGLTIFSSGEESSTTTPPPATSTDRVEFPYYIKIENVDIQDIRLAPSFLNQLNLPSSISEELSHFSFNLQGMIGHNPLKPSLNLHMLLTALPLNNERPPITLGIDAQNNQLSLTLHSHQIPLLNIPLTANLAAYAIAPFQSWKNLVENIFLDSPIEGHFKLNIQEKEFVIKSKYHLFSPQDIQFYDMTATAPGINLEGKSLLKNLEMIDEGVFKGEITEAGNKIFVDGEVKGSLADLLVNLHAHSPQIHWQEQLFENIQTSVQTRIQGDQIEGKADLDFILKDVSYHSQTNFEWNKTTDLLRLKDLAIEALQARLIGQMQIDISKFMLEGFLKTQAAPLAPLAQLANLEAEGEIDLNLIFKPLIENQVVHQGFECHLKGSDIHWKDLFVQRLELNSTLNSVSADLTAHGEAFQLKWKEDVVEHAACMIDCRDFWNNPTGQIQFAVHQAGQENKAIHQLNVETTFSKAAQSWPFRLKGEGELGEKWFLEAHGEWHTDLTNLKMHLAQLKGHYVGLPLTLMQPIDFSYQPEKMIIEPLHIRWGEGELKGAFAGHKQTFSLDFKTNSLSSKFLQAVTPSFPLNGQLSAVGHLEGDFEAPMGWIDLAFQQLQMGDNYLANPPPLNGEIHLKIADNHMQLNSQVFGIGRTPLLFKGILPYRLSLLPFSLQTNPGIDMAIDVLAEGDLDVYLPILAANLPNISGQFKLAAQLSGSINQPQVKGSLKLNNGVYENADTGAVYNRIEAELEGQGPKIILKNLAAYDNKNGSIRMDGAIDIDIKKNFPFDFRIQASRLYVLDSDYATISVSGPLSLRGNTQKAKLGGNLHADEAAVRLEETLPKQIKTIDIQYINLPPGQQPPRIENNGEALELDIKLIAPEVTIKNNSLKSSWKGEIAITGTTKQPLLAGDLRISNGEYNIQGKTFNLSQGSIHFAGAAAKKTTLYVVASKEIDDIRVEVIVKGPLNKLELSFRSNPPLSQREVLSFILFNRGISDITPGEGDTLNQSFISLNASETEEKQDLLTRLRNNMGIDRLDFTASGEGENKDFALQVGKYIWKDVFISVNKSIGAAPDRIAIEAKLKKNLKAEAEVDIGSSSQGKISLKWKRDY